MKNLILTTILLSTLFTFSSCEQKKSELISTQSPDKKLEISIEAVTYSSFDPWVVSISVSQVGSTKQVARVTQEIVADAITENTVKFNWINNRFCQVIFHQANGSVIRVPVRIELQ